MQVFLGFGIPKGGHPKIRNRASQTIVLQPQELVWGAGGGHVGTGFGIAGVVVGTGVGTEVAVQGGTVGVRVGRGGFGGGRWFWGY